MTEEKHPQTKTTNDAPRPLYGNYAGRVLHDGTVVNRFGGPRKEEPAKPDYETVFQFLLGLFIAPPIVMLLYVGVDFALWTWGAR